MRRFSTVSKVSMIIEWRGRRGRRGRREVEKRVDGRRVNVTIATGVNVTIATGLQQQTTRTTKANPKNNKTNIKTTPTN
jgi:hypothetical protein